MMGTIATDLSCTGTTDSCQNMHTIQSVAAPADSFTQLDAVLTQPKERPLASNVASVEDLPDRRTGLLSKMKRLSSRRLLVDEDVTEKPSSQQSQPMLTHRTTSPNQMSQMEISPKRMSPKRMSPTLTKPNSKGILHSTLSAATPTGADSQFTTVASRRTKKSVASNVASVEDLPDRRTGLLSKMKRLSSRRLLVDEDVTEKPSPQQSQPMLTHRTTSPNQMSQMEISPKRMRPKQMNSGQTNITQTSLTQSNPKQLNLKQARKEIMHPERHSLQPPAYLENRRSIMNSVKSLSPRRLAGRKGDTVSYAKSSKNSLHHTHPNSTHANNCFLEDTNSAVDVAFILNKNYQMNQMADLFADFKSVHNSHQSTSSHNVALDTSLRNHKTSKKNLFEVMDAEDEPNLEVDTNDSIVERNCIFSDFSTLASTRSSTETVDDLFGFKSTSSDLVEATSSVTGDRRSMMGRSVSTSALISPRKSSLKHDPLSSCSHSRRDGLLRSSSVKFDKIQVREYECTLGDNPSVSAGPSVSLGWKYTPEKELDVECYESRRPTRRTKQELAIPVKIREDMLVREWGCTVPELRRQSSATDLIKEQRRETAAQNKQSQYMEEVLERSRERLTLPFSNQARNRI